MTKITIDIWRLQRLKAVAIQAAAEMKAVAIQAAAEMKAAMVIPAIQ